MADTVSSLTLVDTSGVKFTGKFTNFSDGTGETLVRKVDASALTIMTEDGNRKIAKINWSINSANAKSATVLKADTARQLKKEDLWGIGGNVEVTNGKGERMTTELLFWDKKEERLYSDAKVQILSDGQLIRGKGFEADQSFNTYRIYKVQGEITVDDE